MITKSQIEKLKDCHNIEQLHALIKTWEAEHFTKEMENNDSVEIIVFNHNKTVEKRVAGKRVSQSFAFCDSAWGEKTFHLMHIKTGLSLLTGKKKAVTECAKELMSKPFWVEFDTAMTNYTSGIFPIEENYTREIRDIYDQCNKKSRR